MLVGAHCHPPEFKFPRCVLLASNEMTARVSETTARVLDQNRGRYSNHILRSFDDDLYKRLEPELRSIEVTRGDVLAQSGERSSQMYFPLEGGVISLLMVTDSGEAVEAGLTGSEGAVGIPALLGNSVSPHQAVGQTNGTAMRIRSDYFLRETENRPRARQAILAYANFVLAQATQLTLCNRLHQVDERLARWLLLFQDRTDSPILSLTHELMSQMLGARRATVSISASTLQEAGLISYVHGKIRVANRKGLEMAACDCYSATKRYLSDYMSVLKGQ